MECLEHVQPRLLREWVFVIYQYLMIKIFVRMDKRMFPWVMHEARKEEKHQYLINVYWIGENSDRSDQWFHRYLLHVLDSVQHMIRRLNL
jgi:hypothetical protein